jgi:hypothetical protein
MAAAIYGGGYLMHDDHFLVVEVAASWADGEDYNNWLPWNQKGSPKAHPANFAYAGSQYLLFKLFQLTGPNTPSDQALVLRLLHGIYSLTIVVLGYLLARSLAPDRPKNAASVAWILAASGFWPLLSVHQLVEMTCIPPLMMGLWALVRSERLRWQDVLLAGIGIGMATGLRYQCGIIGVALVPVLMAQRQWRALLGVGIAALSTFALVQAPDIFIWGEPFVQLRGYIDYNSTHAGNYPKGHWYQYLLTLLGLMIPPASFMLIWGAFHRGRSASAIWWRVVIPIGGFLLFHSAYINKQERFILPAVPALIVIGFIGWQMWTERSAWWGRHRRFENGLWAAFWVISTAVLAASLPYSGKHSRVKAMEFLHAQGAQTFAMVQVDSGSMPPQFYSGSWNSYHIDNRREQQRPPLKVAKSWCASPPSFILFQGDRHLGEAVGQYKAAMPGLRYVTTIAPSRTDRLIHTLNPLNSVERIMIYSTEEALPCP